MRGKKSVETLLTRIRRLLLASGFLNIFLLTFLSTYWFSSPSFDFPASRKAYPSMAEKSTCSRLLLEFRQMPFQQLVLKLQETGFVECGYQQRDIALSCLASKYHFDVERALPNHKLQVRTVEIQGREHLGTFPLFPGLGSREYQSLIHFAKTERWPFTPEGLFIQLKQNHPNPPKSLVNAFIMTNEFKEIHKNMPGLKSLELVNMMFDVDWHTIERAGNCPTPKDILTVLMAGGSKAAAIALLESEPEYALRHLDDSSILQILDLLGDSHPLAASFAQKLLKTPRGDDVWELARQAEESPDEEQPQDFLYVVEKGDSLWKIAQKHKTNVEQLKEFNNLESDVLRPGKILKIPS